MICKNKSKNHETDARVANQEEEEDHLFVATYISSKVSAKKKWLTDSGCTNQMTYDKSLFKELAY
uniref:Gag-pol polyprotein n=1 Tax=Solanum tuberosum TaxID=4113 RepID=M1BMF8_SOLTU